MKATSIIIMIIIIIQVNNSSCNGELKKIEQDFYSCTQLNNKVDEKSICKFNKECLDKIMDVSNDEFFQYPEETSNIYYKAKSGLFYNTQCYIVDNIIIYPHVDQCTRDILINYNNKIGFLTKTGIIRNKSKRRACTNEKQAVTINNIEIVIYKNLVLYEIISTEASKLINSEIVLEKIYQSSLPFTVKIILIIMIIIIFIIFTYISLNANKIIKYFKKSKSNM